MNTKFIHQWSPEEINHIIATLRLSGVDSIVEFLTALLVATAIVNKDTDLIYDFTSRLLKSFYLRAYGLRVTKVTFDIVIEDDRLNYERSEHVEWVPGESTN